MTDKTVWMISGNKGGVGKSLFSLALASAFEMRGEQFAIFDGDGRTGDVFAAFRRKCPARQGDFRDLRPDSHLCSLDGQYESQLQQLLGGSPHVIVNTPDGADKVLMKWFDVTLSHTEQANVNFRMVYLMSDRPDGLEILPELAQRFQFLYPVRNLHFGAPKLFNAFNKGYMPGFKVVLDMPALRRDEVRLLFDKRMYPSEVLRLRKPANGQGQGPYAVHTLQRARILAWQRAINDFAWDMADNNEMPNLEFGKW